MEHLDLPRFDVPETAPKPVEPVVFHEWLLENMRLFKKAVDPKRICDQPARRPAGARFVLR
ncbi:MAG: hypothetical protein HY897_00175 [Deltaproteobacteria bacterium]|nr:hypothetical protein [Deltaproteobacteria bacterium]